MDTSLIIIRTLHLIIIIAIMLSIIIPNCFLKKLVLTLLIFLLLQHMLGYEKCGLTQLEYLILKEKYQDGFLYRLINPMIKVRQEYFYNGVLYAHLAIMCILVYQIYYRRCR